MALFERKKTARWLAGEMGVTPSIVSKWCTNTSQPDLATILKIADLLKVGIRELFVKGNKQFLLSQKARQVFCIYITKIMNLVFTIWVKGNNNKIHRQGFVDFNTRMSSENSGKADSYVRAIQILDEVVLHQSVIALQDLSCDSIGKAEHRVERPHS